MRKKPSLRSVDSLLTRPREAVISFRAPEEVERWLMNTVPERERSSFVLRLVLREMERQSAQAQPVADHPCHVDFSELHEHHHEALRDGHIDANERRTLTDLVARYLHNLRHPLQTYREHRKAA